jgi:hypothetical protein
LEWIEASHIPIFDNLVHVHLTSKGAITVINESGASFQLELPNREVCILVEGQRVVIVEE